MSLSGLDADAARSASMLPGQSPLLLSASSVIGDEVRNGKHDKLGDIHELMLDTQTGQIRYAVLSSGGFLGMGDRLFAIPWRALKLDAVNQCFTLDVETDRLKAAPGFAKDQWPNMADWTWASDVDSYYPHRKS